MKQKINPTLWLRAEGLALLVASVWYFYGIGGNWLLFAALLLAVDISMIGYVKSTRLGAITYNVGHSLVLPIILLIFWHDGGLVTQLAIIWIAHIGMDRLFGYGLKYGDDFKHTHLGRIGGAK